jgi:hypothetical protein
MKRLLEEFKSWHRGLPNPPGTPDFNFRLLGRVWKETNSMYGKGLVQFYGRLWGRMDEEEKEQNKKEEAKMEKQTSTLAKEAAEAIKNTKLDGPAVFTKWIAPKIALVSEALLQFGRGYREGKNAPEIDVKEWFPSMGKSKESVAEEEREKKD